jgi:hypothetical protein
MASPPLLTFALLQFLLIDAAAHSVLICDYTGKEVVG